MEEEDIILLAQENARQQQPLLQVLNSIDTKLERQYKRTNRSIRVSIDLTEAHTDKPLGLRTDITYLWLLVEHADSVFTFKLKQTNQQISNPFLGTTGAILAQHEFTEVLITNAASTGQAIIQVGWRD